MPGVGARWPDPILATIDDGTDGTSQKARDDFDPDPHCRCGGLPGDTCLVAHCCQFERAADGVGCLSRVWRRCCSTLNSSPQSRLRSEARPSGRVPLGTTSCRQAQICDQFEIAAGSRSADKIIQHRLDRRRSERAAVLVREVRVREIRLRSRRGAAQINS